MAKENNFNPFDNTDICKRSESRPEAIGKTIPTTFDDEAENEAGLQDLEDWGAFSDEGIMPGCHSDYSDEF